jgi:hypothetical protein
MPGKWLAGRKHWVNSAARALKRYVTKTDNCWIWNGPIDKGGYGRTGVDGKDRASHRLIYEHFKGSIPEGLQIDHLCRNRRCVNPDHLEPVTLQENLRRGFGPAALNRRKVVCMRGHALSGENLYVNPRGQRQCKACRLMNQRLSYARKKRA